MGSAENAASVIIPTYYRNDLLREAIESALDQTYNPVEVVVVDDSGEAYAEPVVDGYDVTYVPLDENRGENPARTAGIRASSGHYIQFLDDDDIIRAEKIEKQVPRIDESTGVVYSGLEYYHTGETVSPNSEVRGDVLEYALQFRMWPPCFTSSMLLDRDVLEQVLPLEYHGAGDTTFMIDLAQRTEFAFVDEPLVLKRLTEDNLGASWDNVRNKRELLDIHEDRYDAFPDAVRHAALTDIYRITGLQYMSSERWSLAAIVAFARAAYYAPDNRLDHLCTLLGSLFGQPGLDTRRKLLGPTWRKHW